MQPYRGRVGDINVDIARFEGKSGKTWTIETQRTSWKTKENVLDYTVIIQYMENNLNSEGLQLKTEVNYILRINKGSF